MNAANNETRLLVLLTACVESVLSGLKYQYYYIYPLLMALYCFHYLLFAACMATAVFGACLGVFCGCCFRSTAADKKSYFCMLLVYCIGTRLVFWEMHNYFTSEWWGGVCRFLFWQESQEAVPESVYFGFALGAMLGAKWATSVPTATPKGLLEVLLGRDMDEEAEQMSSLNAYSPVSGSAGLLSRAFALLVSSLVTFAMLQHGLLFSIALHMILKLSVFTVCIIIHAMKSANTQEYSQLPM